MGDVNQRIYLRRHCPTVDGPVLEVGSKDYGSTSSFRDLYAEQQYVGCDMEAGPGVDVVQDLTQGTGDLPLGHFALVICCSVLEHTPTPWLFAQSLTALVRPTGTLYICVPWVWRYHPYPDDYFRFSWRGIVSLFPDFSWRQVSYATNVAEEFIPIATDGPPQYGEDSKMVWRKPLGTDGRVKRKYLPYLQLCMLGTKTGIGD